MKSNEKKNERKIQEEKKQAQTKLKQTCAKYENVEVISNQFFPSVSL